MNQGPKSPTSAFRSFPKFVKLALTLLAVVAGPLLLVAMVAILIAQFHTPLRALTWHVTLLATLSVILYLALVTAAIFIWRKWKTGEWLLNGEERETLRKGRALSATSPIFRRWMTASWSIILLLQVSSMAIEIWKKMHNPHREIAYSVSIDIFMIALSAYSLWARPRKTTVTPNL